VLVTKIEDGDGTVLYEHVPTFRRVMDESVADEVNATLTEVVRRGTGQQAKIGRPISGKTGTTEGNFDAWFVGYTAELSAAVWVGFHEGNRAMTSPDTPFSITGGTWPAQIWSRFAIAALSGIAYAAPAGLEESATETVRIDIHRFPRGPLCPRSGGGRRGVAGGPRSVDRVPDPQSAGPGDPAERWVPTIEAFSIVDAVSLLEAGGYEVELVWDDGSAQVPGTVIGQVPGAGTTLGPGSIVQVVAAGPEPGTVVRVRGRHRADAVARPRPTASRSR
jgi:penicillin-binding protein 1A